MVQDVESCSKAKVSAKLLGPVSLVGDASKELLSTEVDIDTSVWLANDTTGQCAAVDGRTGGRATFEWTTDDFAGATWSLCTKHADRCIAWVKDVSPLLLFQYTQMSKQE